MAIKTHIRINQYVPVDFYYIDTSSNWLYCFNIEHMVYVQGVNDQTSNDICIPYTEPSHFGIQDELIIINGIVADKNIQFAYKQYLVEKHLLEG